MNNKLKKYTKLIILILIIIFFMLLTNDNNVYALEDPDSYTDQYKKYLELSEEEKKKVDVIPEKYGISLKNYNKNKISSARLFSSNNNANIPSRYNLAEKYNIKVENQGQEGNCWTFASLETLETYLQIHGYGTFDFSENHLNYLESNLFTESEANRDINTAGHFENFKDYADNKLGPVLEEDFPYYEEGTKNYKKYLPSEYESLLNVTPIAYVGEYVSFPYVNKENEQYSESELLEFRNSVKKHIMENGAVATTIVAPSYYTGRYYNDKSYAAYFPNSSEPSFWDYSHLVAIIGWDDDFSKENFVEGNRPEHDGAYIALNSWGKEFGDNGIYYILYDDVYVENYLCGIKEAATDISDLKNTITFTVKDKNLYNGLKQNLGKKINICNDHAQSITMLTAKLNEITDLDLSNLNITDLSGIENFINLSSINLSNNNISTIESLKSLHNLTSLNLSYNKFTEVPIELKESDINILSLSYNNIENFDNLRKIKSIRLLELEGTNFNNEDLELLKNLGVINLNLSKTKTTDYSILKAMEIYQLNISYNENIIYESIPNVMGLNISHTNIADDDFKKITDISYMNALDISYTNIKDLSILPDVLRVIYISGNKNLTNFDNLKYDGSIFYQDVELEDVSIFKGFNATEINLENNNIKDYKDLLENENLMFLNLSNNKLSNIEYSDIIMLTADGNNIKPDAGFLNNVISLKNQNYEQILKVDLNRKNIFKEIAYYIKNLYLAGYNLNITNASIDYENETFEVDDISKDVVIEFENGKFEGSKITYKIEKIYKSNIDYIYIDRSTLKKKYLEGESFDKSELKVYASYDNETICQIDDYEVIGGDNLQKGLNIITIQKDGFTDYIYLDVIAKEDVLTLNFESEAIYKATLEKINQIEKDRKEYSEYYSRLDVLINKDDKNKVIQIYKDDINDITYIEIISDEQISLNDIKQLKSLNTIGLNGKSFDIVHLKDIKEFLEDNNNLSGSNELFSLQIKNNDKIITIEDDIYSSLIIENSKIKHINKLSNLFYLQYNGNQILEMEEVLDTLQIIDVNVTSNIENIERDKDNNLVLPKIFKTFHDKGLKIEINICDQIRDEKFLNPYNKNSIEVTEKEGNLIIDYSKLKEANYDGMNQFIEISVIDINEKYVKFNYKYSIKYKLFIGLELDLLEPIEVEEDVVPDLSNLKVYKVYSNKEKELLKDFTYSKDVVTKNTEKIEISYSEDGITSKIDVPIKVIDHIHSWGEWKITKQPTETEEGQKERICLKNENHKQIAVTSFEIVNKQNDNSDNNSEYDFENKNNNSNDESENLDNNNEIKDDKNNNYKIEKENENSIIKTGDNVLIYLIIFICSSLIFMVFIKIKN